MHQLVDIIKRRCSISGSFMDADISGWINEAFASLEADGVNTQAAETDPLLIAAAESYVKEQIDYLGQAERYRKKFQEQTVALASDVNHKARTVD